MKKRFSSLMIAAIALSTWHAESIQAQTNRSSSSSSSSSYSSSTGPGGTSYSRSSSANTITLKDSPILDALVTVSRNAQTPTYLSKGAADMIRGSRQKVTMSERNLSPEALITKALTGTDLVVVPIGANVCILTRDDSIAALKENVAAAIETKSDQVKGLISLSTIQLDIALLKPITLTMFQTPAPFVAQMLEGMGGVKISLPREYQDQFFTQQPMVSVDAQQQPLGDVLESVATQLGCKVDVSQGVILLRKPVVAQ